MRQSTLLIVNTVTTIGRIVFSLLLSLVSTRLIVGALGAVDWGVLTALGASGVMVSLISTSLSSSAERHLAFEIGRENRHELQVVFNTLLLLFFIVGCAMWMIGSLIAVPLLALMKIPADREAAAYIVFHITLLEIVKSAWLTPFRAAISARQALTFLSVFDSATAVNRLAAGVAICFLPGDRLVKFAAINIVGQLLIALALVISCMIMFEETRPHLRLISRSRFRQLGSFAGWTMVLRAGWLFRLQGGTLLLNLFFGPIVNGAYGISVIAANLLVKISYSLMQVTQSAMTSVQARGNRQQLQTLCLLSSKYTTFACLMMTVPIVIETPTFLHLWLGTYPPDTVIFVRLILIWNTIVLSVRGHDTAIMAVGTISRYVVFSSAINMSALVLSCLCFAVFQWEPWVLPVFSIVSSLLIVVYNVTFVGSIIQVPAKEWVCRSFLPVVKANIVPVGVAGVLRLVMQEGFVRAGAVLVAYVATALICFWLTLEPVEKQRLGHFGSQVLARLNINKQKSQATET